LATSLSRFKFVFHCDKKLKNAWEKEKNASSQHVKSASLLFIAVQARFHGGEQAEQRRAFYFAESLLARSRDIGRGFLCFVPPISARDPFALSFARRS